VIRRSKEHRAPLERQNLVYDEAINIPLLRSTLIRLAANRLWLLTIQSPRLYNRRNRMP
jgi:hypothetical protein